MRKALSTVIFFFIMISFAHANHETGGLRGTRVTVVRQFGSPYIVCMLYKDYQPATMRVGGQNVTLWFIGPHDQISVVGGQMNPSEPEYGSFVLQLTCYIGTAQDLLSGRVAQVMQRPVCNTAPIRYEYGPYMAEEVYRFGSLSFPCYMER